MQAQTDGFALWVAYNFAQQNCIFECYSDPHQNYAPRSNLDVKVKIMISITKTKAKVTSLKQHLLIACHFVAAATEEPFVKGKRSLSPNMSTWCLPIQNDTVLQKPVDYIFRSSAISTTISLRCPKMWQNHPRDFSNKRASLRLHCAPRIILNVSLLAVLNYFNIHVSNGKTSQPGKQGLCRKSRWRIWKEAEQCESMY